MVVLADEVLESFFDTDLSGSFKLESVSDMELPTSHSGFLGDIWSSIATDSNKKMFNMFTDEIGKTIGKHQVVNKPSIGRYTRLEEPKARESLLTPTLRKSTSNTSLVPSSRPLPTTTPAVSSTSTSSTLTIDTNAELSKSDPSAPDTGGLSAMPMIQAANAALMERPQFAIDDAKDDEDEDDSDLGDVDNDDQVMDEVLTNSPSSRRVLISNFEP